MENFIAILLVIGLVSWIIYEQQKGWDRYDSLDWVTYYSRHDVKFQQAVKKLADLSTEFTNVGDAAIEVGNAMRSFGTAVGKLDKK